MVALMEKGCVNEVEYHVMTRDGRKILLETSASLIKGKNGVSTGIVAVSRDITERKRMEEVLRKSEEQFRALVENALDAIVVVNGEGVITYASPSNDRMLGYPLSQIIGKDGFSLAHPEDMPDVIAAYTRLIEEPGKPVSVEARLRHNDGSWRTVEAVAQNLVENDSVKGIVVNWRDVTERKKAEDALRESESRHRLYFESVTDVIYSLDKDFRFESISPSVENVLGYKPEEVVGKRFDEIKLLVPETVKQAFVDVMRALAGERIVTYGKFVRKDGGIVYGEVSLTPIFAPDGSVKGALGVARDVTERKLMENALKGSERAYRLLFDSIIDGLIVIDAETLKVVLANRQVPRIFGFNSVEETIKADPMDYIHPEDRERVLKIIVEDMFRKDLRQVSEFRVRARDGRELWISVLGTRTEYGGRTAGLVSIRDITDRKRVEETARETEERFRRLVNNAQDIVFRWSIDKGLEYVSPVALSITGYSAEELMSNPMVGMELAREGDPIITADYRRVIAGGLSLRSREISFIRKDGKRIYLDMLSQSIRDSEEKIIAFEGILRDITERKEMERALQQREQDYLLLLESTHEGMIVIDAGTLKVLFGNRRASLMFDFDPEVQEGIGVDLLDFVHPDDREVVIHGFNDDLPKLEHRKRFEVRAKTKHGREIIVSALATRVEFQARLAVLLSLKDITEQRRLEEERQKMEEQLQLAGRLAAVGELAAGVAHELNNPIAAVQGYAQLLTAKRDIDESVKKDLDIIYREAQRAGKITKNLLSFARMHEPEKRFISINEALEKTLELSAHQMKINNIELEVALAPDLPRTMADFHQMQQVFVNIINNAEQAMLESHGKGKLVVRTRKYGDMIQITFTDDGPGIAEENLKRIFDPFFTTKEVGKGTGLGLSICYGLIEAHNGRIYARSKLGEGATFIVEMPIVPEEQSAAEAVFIKTKRGSARWRK
jgi:PAS domain S-box-containing protein